jgi:UDP-N-acetylmuramyl pentapeptide phosphotransferase/UDP-N-acetylglucosamine-1-phosphate transferase
MQGYQTYEIVFLGAMLVAVLATPIVTRIARAMRVVDEPNVRKIHAAAIPRLGGAAIVFAVLAFSLPILFLDNAIGQAFRRDQVQFIVLMAGGLFMFAVGLADDLVGLRARVKLLAQLAAALAVCASGTRIESVVVEGLVTIDFGWLSWPITVFWIVGITNALNLIDGLDGLAAGISVIVCGVIATFALYEEQVFMAVLMLSVVGGLLGFLFLNFNPARIFMGDCGSLFLGFVISASSVRSAEKAATVVGLALPFVALGVPIFDTLFSILRRTLQRRGIMSPDRGHIHHRLLQLGFKQHQVAILIYLVTLITGGLGLFMIFVRGAGMLAIFGGVLVLLLLAFRAVGAVRFRETLAAVRHNRSIARQVLEQRHAFEDVDLRARDAKTFDQWWGALCLAADKLEFLKLSLDMPTGDGGVRTLLWRRAAPLGPPCPSLAMSMPIRPQGDGPALRAEIEVYVNGSVESAGRRVSLFGRLIDEHRIADLPAGEGRPPESAPQAPGALTNPPQNP